MKINLTLKDVKVEIIQHAEDVSPECMFGHPDKIKDPIEREYARQDIDWIYTQLERYGNWWAWCVVEVRVTWCGLSESAILGACSFKNEQAFIDDGYYDDMCDEALDRLNKHLNDLYDVLYTRVLSESTKEEDHERPA